jgi:ferric-dicitrate binding protein FerR (iron transport regulator)
LNTEIIERFFKKQCTPDEAREVAAYLNANPGLLEKYVSMYEWNAIEANTMPEEFWSEVWLNIQKKNKAKIIFIRVKRAAIVACLIFMIGAISYYLIPEKQISKPIAQLTVLPKPQHQLITNNTKKIKAIVLEDSSIVQLSPGSFIQYDVPFAENTRDIFLTGEGKFIVAKNKKKPFTVYTGMLATTALGTIFSVKTTAKKNNITVKLFSGKVLIHAESAGLKGWDKDVYLLPGEQMKYNAASLLVSVEKIHTVNTNVAVKLKKGADSSNNALTFSNTLLPQVMQQLSAYYNVKIKYDSTIIGKMNFTGTVTKNDSLTVILKAISQMNNLDIIQTENEFIISKHEQTQ